VSCHPTENKIASGGLDNDRTVRLWVQDSWWACKTKIVGIISSCELCSNWKQHLTSHWEICQLPMGHSSSYINAGGKRDLKLNLTVNCFKIMCYPKLWTSTDQQIS
jgi:hypothetical protein